LLAWHISGFPIDGLDRFASTSSSPLAVHETHGRNLILPSVGLFSRCRELWRPIGALDVVNSFRDRPAGTLRLNVPSSAARLVLPAIVPPFLAAYPEIRLEVIAEESFVDVLAAGCDAGIRYDEMLEQDMIAVPIGPRVQRFAAAAVLLRFFKATDRAPRCQERERSRQLGPGSASKWERSIEPSLEETAQA
jgi:DNA-binding transcriptional LysR family regulator